MCFSGACRPSMASCRSCLSPGSAVASARRWGLPFLAGVEFLAKLFLFAGDIRLPFRNSFSQRIWLGLFDFWRQVGQLDRPVDRLSPGLSMKFIAVSPMA